MKSPQMGLSTAQRLAQVIRDIQTMLDALGNPDLSKQQSIAYREALGHLYSERADLVESAFR